MGGVEEFSKKVGEEAKQFLLSTPNYYLLSSEFLWSAELQRGTKKNKTRKVVTVTILKPPRQNDL